MISARRPLAGMAGDGYGMLGTILLCAIVVLLLVVLVPLGVVLYQRLRVTAPPAARRAPPPAPRAAVPPLPTPPSSTRPEPSPSPAVPTPTERAMPAVSVAKATVAAPLDFEATVAARGGSGEPGATEMVQWNGMLSCTAGALEGQRWIIEDQGLYIGRDSTMAQVVILDSHISKRHVRIVPRDGHVWAIDQSSTNGTFLGKTGTPRITEVQLKRGDVLILGDNVASFLYQI
jgi:hypothetical protein